MYGDTHVDPAPLFDPGAGGRPPADAVDVYFHAPLSLSLIADAFAHHRMDRELELLREIYTDVAAQAVVDLQRQGGYVTVGPHNRPDPARLELTSLVEDTVPGIPTMRLHLHVYLGRTATALNTGERHPIHLEELREAADFAWRGYLNRLGRESSRQLGFEWAAEPGRHSANQEIVDPPMAEHVGGQEFGICPGEFGPREQILADARWRAGIAEMERFMAADRERRATG